MPPAPSCSSHRHHRACGRAFFWQISAIIESILRRNLPIPSLVRLPLGKKEPDSVFYGEEIKCSEQKGSHAHGGTAATATTGERASTNAIPTIGNKHCRSSCL